MIILFTVQMYQCFQHCKIKYNIHFISATHLKLAVCDTVAMFEKVQILVRYIQQFDK